MKKRTTTKKKKKNSSQVPRKILEMEKGLRLQAQIITNSHCNKQQVPNRKKKVAKWMLPVVKNETHLISIACWLNVALACEKWPRGHRFERIWPQIAVQQCSGISGDAPTASPPLITVNKLIGGHMNFTVYMCICAHMEPLLIYLSERSLKNVIQAADLKIMHVGLSVKTRFMKTTVRQMWRVGDGGFRQVFEPIATSFF